MFSINEFCRQRKIPKKIRDAFAAYSKSYIAEYYKFNNGKTSIDLLINLDDKEVEEIWGRFVLELKDLLSK